MEMIVWEIQAFFIVIRLKTKKKDLLSLSLHSEESEPDSGNPSSNPGSAIH